MAVQHSWTSMRMDHPRLRSSFTTRGVCRMEIQRHPTCTSRGRHSLNARYHRQCLPQATSPIPHIPPRLCRHQPSPRLYSNHHLLVCNKRPSIIPRPLKPHTILTRRRVHLMLPSTPSGRLRQPTPMRRLDVVADLLYLLPLRDLHRQLHMIPMRHLGCPLSSPNHIPRSTLVMMCRSLDSLRRGSRSTRHMYLSRFSNRGLCLKTL